MEKKKVIVLDVDMVFSDVCLAKHNEDDNPCLLDTVKFHYETFQELETKCGIYTPQVKDYFSKLDYSKVSVASDFLRLIAEFKLKFSEEDYSWIVISHTPEDFSDHTHTTKKDFIKETMELVNIHHEHYEIHFTDKSGQKGELLKTIHEDLWILGIVDDNLKEIQSYIDAGFNENYFYAPERLIWKDTLQREFKHLINFYS